MPGNPFTAAKGVFNTVIEPYLRISDLVNLWSVRKGLQPAISAALDQDFDAHLEAANALPSGYGRAKALAEVCWMYDRLPKNGGRRTSVRQQELADAVCHADELGMTALHTATRKENHAVVRPLLPHAGASVNKLDCVNRTPLHMVAARGDAALVRLLLQVPGVSVSQQDSQGRTPLHMAASCVGDDDVVALLIHAGAPLNKLDNCGQSAEDLAATSGFSERVNMLAAARRTELAAQQALPASPVAPGHDHSFRPRESVPVAPPSGPVGPGT